MKYMGSKREMLRNGLGEAIGREISGARRFVDLFTGSAAVAWHVAARWDVPVLAIDLQQFAVALADAVIGRRTAISWTAVAAHWMHRARLRLDREVIYKDASAFQARVESSSDIASLATEARDMCLSRGVGPIQSAYGGYYFSPLQACWLDAMRAELPLDREHRAFALAVLIQAASRLAAAPGHTAQPFKPTRTAGTFLLESWRREVASAVEASAGPLAAHVAKRRGKAIKADAIAAAATLKEGDLAFIDPPYSSVHYSRFYHVLETVAHGEHIEVSGNGRYPVRAHRPSSDFSVKSRATPALTCLLEGLSKRGARAIVTFPAGCSSNGLSGELVTCIAEHFFFIERRIVASRFSTLGGNRVHRQARHYAKELILTLRPR